MLLYLMRADSGSSLVSIYACWHTGRNQTAHWRQRRGTSSPLHTCTRDRHTCKLSLITQDASTLHVGRHGDIS